MEDIDKIVAVYDEVKTAKRKIIEAKTTLRQAEIELATKENILNSLLERKSLEGNTGSCPFCKSHNKRAYFSHERFYVCLDCGRSYEFAESKGNM